MSNPSKWWYGVAFFPVVSLASVVTHYTTRAFVRVSTGQGDPNVAAGVISFLAGFLASWVGVLVAVVVLVFLAADVRALRGRAAWSPSRAWVAAGVAHLVGAAFAPFQLVSVPALAYYLYRRHERVGAP